MFKRGDRIIKFNATAGESAPDGAIGTVVGKSLHDDDRFEVRFDGMNYTLSILRTKMKLCASKQRIFIAKSPKNNPLIKE